MRKLIALIFMAVIGQPALQAAEPGAAGKVFMFIPDGSRDLELMLNEEVGVMRELLENAGYALDIATSDGKPMQSKTQTITPTVELQDVDVNEYAGVILPCMAPAPGSDSTPDIVAAIVEQAIVLGKPVAASRGSVETLAKAGGLAGRDYAFASAVDIDERPEFKNGNFLGTGVVRDGLISTAGICPLAARSSGEQDGTVELTQHFIRSLAEAS